MPPLGPKLVLAKKGLVSGAFFHLAGEAGREGYSLRMVQCEKQQDGAENLPHAGVPESLSEIAAELAKGLLCSSGRKRKSFYFFPTH